MFSGKIFNPAYGGGGEMTPYVKSRLDALESIAASSSMRSKGNSKEFDRILAEQESSEIFESCPAPTGKQKEMAL